MHCLLGAGTAKCTYLDGVHCAPKLCSTPHLCAKHGAGQGTRGEFRAKRGRWRSKFWMRHTVLAMLHSVNSTRHLERTTEAMGSLHVNEE